MEAEGLQVGRMTMPCWGSVCLSLHAMPPSLTSTCRRVFQEVVEKTKPSEDEEAIVASKHVEHIKWMMVLICVEISK